MEGSGPDEKVLEDDGNALGELASALIRIAFRGEIPGEKANI